MEFNFLLQCMNILYIIWLGSFLQKVESIPVSISEVFIPDVTNSSTLSEYLKYDSDESREMKNVGLSNASKNEIEEKTNESSDIVEKNANKKRLRKNLLSTSVVPYKCDIEKGMCWLNQNQDNLVTFLVPIKLLPNKQPPSEIGLKEFYSLVSTKKKQQMDNFDSTNLNSSTQDQDASSGAHPRRKRDTQYSEENDNPQQEWANQGEYESDQSPRVQRNIPSTSTEHSTTSTDSGRTQRNADLQAMKQSKRSAEMDDDDVEDDDFGSPSPDDDYQEENDMDYHPEKRFARPETIGTTPKSSGDSPTKNPSQVSRRAAMNPNYNYPFFANPDMYYPSQRMLSPFDGIGYRSVDALPIMYMDPNPAYWPTKFARSPQQYYQQRQAPGYGRGWPPSPPYYQPFANRYQPTYPSSGQQNRGHYRHQYPQQQSYRPFSYSYAQGNKNYKAPVRKPIETDANMYYGK